MRKVAIFTEGQSELIFIRNLLGKIYEYSELSFECVKLHAGDLRNVPYKLDNPFAKIHFLLINVQGDGNVLSAIKDRQKKLISDGYHTIIGLRDMYSDEYDKYSGGCIKPEITKKFIDGHDLAIKNMDGSNRIKFFFSIMELESWFLSMFTVFEKIEPSLTVDFINQRLNINIEDVNIEEIYHPSNVLKRIYQLCEMKYDKSESDIENISSKISFEDIMISIENNKCESFKNFFQALQVS